MGAKPPARAASAFMARINVYIDGFNLYFRALRNTPYRWLNLDKMSSLLMGGAAINQIKYFTALVKPRPADPEESKRQRQYLRALKTLPNLQIIKGTFRSQTKYRPLAKEVPPLAPGTIVPVINSEEKGSDVNLAVHLVHDAHAGNFDVAVVVSNDSDLAEAIRIANGLPKVRAGLANPAEYPAYDLRDCAAFYKKIRKGLLAASQFPDKLADTDGEILKPKTW